MAPLDSSGASLLYRHLAAPRGTGFARQPSHDADPSARLLNEIMVPRNQPPRGVARETPAPGLRNASPETLDDIARRVKAFGIPCQVSYKALDAQLDEGALESPKRIP